MKYYQWNSENHSLDDFITECLKDLNVISKKSKKKYNFDTNIFSVNNYEVSYESYENDYYSFDIQKIPESITIQFGCELETCFVLNCTTDEFNDKIEKKLIEIKENPIEAKKSFKWGDLILYHLRTNIIPFLSKKFLKRFSYAYIMKYHQGNAVYVDLSKGMIVDSKKPVDDYYTLQFAQDSSVKCGDSDPKDKSLTVHCEIITPVLDDISDLKLLYENLFLSKCGSSNKSSGFHVNISVLNDDQIKFTPWLMMELSKHWYNFEKKYYQEYRGTEFNKYARNLSEYADNLELMKIGFQCKDGKEITQEDLNKEYGIKNLYYVDQFNYKYTSLFRKSEDLLEFRVFPSKTDLKLLIDYTNKAIDIVEKSLSAYVNDHEKLMKIYESLENEYEFNTPIYYTYKTGVMQIVLRNYEGSYDNFRNYLRMFEQYEWFWGFSFYNTSIGSFFSTLFSKNKMELETGNHNYKVESKAELDTKNIITTIFNIKINYKPEEDYIKIYDYVFVKSEVIKKEK